MAASSPLQERPRLQPAQTGFRRSVTLPPRSLSYHEKAGLDPSDSAADILYSHPSARIVKFSPPRSAIPSVSTPIPQDLDYPVDTVETLPWASTTETTMASGLMVIEKVQGSTNFLKSGAVMHAILRNSQCWCVDGESKFVLRIGKFQYYRIELPTNSEEDRAKVEELKVTLKKILRFERTPCPFKRGFHVDLPESEITPRRKGKWKRRQSSQIPTAVGEIPSPLSHGRSSTAEAIEVGTRFGKDGQEDESFTNGSEFDDEDMQFESDGSEEHSSPSPVGPISEPGIECGDELKGDGTDKFQTEEGEARLHKLSEGQTNPESPEPAAEAPEMIPADEPSMEARTLEEAQPIPDIELVEHGVDEREVGHLAAESSTKSDAQMEAAAQSTPTPAGVPTGELSRPDVKIAEPAPSELYDKESENQELDEYEADNVNVLTETQSNSQWADAMSVASSSNSFCSLDGPESPTSPRSQSPPASPPSPTPCAELSDPLAMDSYHAHQRELSELTLTTSSPRVESLTDLVTASPNRPSTSASDRPTTPQLAQSSVSDGSWPEVETPSGPLPMSQIRHRLNARRSLSPLPPSPTLFTPLPQQDRSNHLTSAILQKACSLALGKPIEVVVMLIHVLARIARGATVNDLMSGDLFKVPGYEREQERSGSLPDQIEGNGEDELDEDDFGVPLRGRGRNRKILRADNEFDSFLDLD